MTTFVNNDLDVSAANVVASGQPLYPAVERTSAVAAIANHANPSPASAEQRAAIFADPVFGKYFTDNVVRAIWTKADGWPCSPLSSARANLP